MPEKWEIPDCTKETACTVPQIEKIENSFNYYTNPTTMYFLN